MARRAKIKEHTVEGLLEDCHAVPKDLMASLEHLREFTQPYIRLLPDRRQHRLGEAFLRGLLSDLDRKSTEPIAENAGMYRRPLQRFIGDSHWDHRPLLKELSAHVERELGDPDGILIIDPSSFPKKGTHSVGVARQWCGHLGKVDNCQAGVFLGYKTNKGHALIDERLYMPREWMRDKERRLECGVPKELRFLTAQQLALEMLRERRELPHSWIAADDESGQFRRKLRQLGERCVLDVPGGTGVRDLWAPAPARNHTRGRAPKVKFVSASAWKDAVPAEAWQRVHIRERIGNMNALRPRAPLAWVPSP